MTWGKKPNPGILAAAASAYENSAVRRLGYLLEHLGTTDRPSHCKFVERQSHSKLLIPRPNRLLPPCDYWEKTRSGSL